MSTLRDLISERRAADAPLGLQSATAATASPALLIQKWDNQSWVLPWSYFLGAHHASTDGGEQLVLSFSLGEVLVQGARLDLLLPDIAAYRLESLRELPEKYREAPSASTPSIREILVKPTNRPDEPLALANAHRERG